MEQEVMDKFDNKSLSLTVYTMMAIAGYADLYENIDFTRQEIGDHSYYNMYTWTKEQENEFKEWMREQMKKSKYRKDMCRFPSLCKSKRMQEKFINEFLFNHSLKYKQDEA